MPTRPSRSTVRSGFDLTITNALSEVLKLFGLDFSVSEDADIKPVSEDSIVNDAIAKTPKTTKIVDTVGEFADKATKEPSLLDTIGNTAKQVSDVLGKVKSYTDIKGQLMNLAGLNQKTAEQKLVENLQSQFPGGSPLNLLQEQFTPAPTTMKMDYGIFDSPSQYGDPTHLDIFKMYKLMEGLKGK